MSQDLGIGLGFEGVAALLERLPDGARVLDDPVVDDGDAAGLVGVGMGVQRGGRAVGGPARVADAGMAGRAVTVEVIGQVRELAGLLLDEDAALVGADRDSGRVVAAVFEAPQALDQDRRGVSRTDVSDDPADVFLLAVRRR